MFVLPTVYSAAETMADAVEALKQSAINAAQRGAQVIILDDGGAFSDNDTLPVDTHLALIAVDRALRETRVSATPPTPPPCAAARAWWCAPAASATCTTSSLPLARAQMPLPPP